MSVLVIPHRAVYLSLHLVRLHRSTAISVHGHMEDTTVQDRHIIVLYQQFPVDLQKSTYST